MYKTSNILATMLILLFIVTACTATDAQVLPTLVSVGDQNATDSDSVDANTDNSSHNTTQSTSNASFENLELGTNDLSISGAISSDGSYSDEEAIASYEPFRSSNSAGQHELEIYTDLTPTDLTDETFVIVYVRFPADIEPGIYDIHTRDRNAPELVQGFVAFDNIAVADFDENVSGTLEIIEIGEQITASFNFSAHSGRDETLSVDVTGRVNQVVFNYRPEIMLTLSGLVTQEFTTLRAFEDDTLTSVTQYFLDDFSNEFRWDANFRDNDFTHMAEILFYFPSDIQPGTYDVAYAASGNQKVPEGSQVGARLSYQDDDASIDFNADTITGTVSIAVDERNYASATFTITGTDSDTGESLTLDGTYLYFENQFGG